MSESAIKRQTLVSVFENVEAKAGEITYQATADRKDGGEVLFWLHRLNGPAVEIKGAAVARRVLEAGLRVLDEIER